MRQLLAIRDARIYLAGQAFSLFGDSALWLAMAVWVKTLTNSNGASGLVFFFFTAPTLLAPLSGLIVDRLRRRPVLIVTNALTGAAVLLLLLVNTAHQVWLVYLVMALYGLSYSVLGSAQSALLSCSRPNCCPTPTGRCGRYRNRCGSLARSLAPGYSCWSGDTLWQFSTQPPSPGP